MMEREDRRAQTVYEVEGFGYRTKTSWLTSLIAYVVIRLGALFVLCSLFFLPWSSSPKTGFHYPGQLFSGIAYQTLAGAQGLPPLAVDALEQLAGRFTSLTSSASRAFSIYSTAQLPWFALSVALCFFGIVLCFLVKRRAIVTPLGLITLGVGAYGGCAFMTSGKEEFHLRMGFYFAVVGLLLLFAEVVTYRRTAKPHKSHYSLASRPAVNQTLF